MQRKVQSAPGLQFFDRELPKDFLSVFPHVKIDDYSNGILFYRFEKKQLNRNFEQIVAFVIGLRQYIHYHLHSIKTQLHTRMRGRVETFERVLKVAKREDEGPISWRETFGGESQEDRELKEQKKVEEVFKH